MDRDKKLEEERKRRNQDLIERAQRGENTALIPPQATWFPPRPLIKKDRKSMLKLFDEKDGDAERTD